MKVHAKSPPRVFDAGGGVMLTDTGSVALAADEQIGVLTEAGTGIEVTRKSWGFYALGSLNKRLPEQGFTVKLMGQPKNGRVFLMLIEVGKEQEAQAYFDRWGHQEVWTVPKAPLAIDQLRVKEGAD